MDARWQFLFFLLAVLCFVAYAFEVRPRITRKSINLLALGLAFFVFPFAWNAAVAGW